jgi:hypothetical protein
MKSRTSRSLKRSLCFYPDQPPFKDLLEGIRQYAGWDLAPNPESADWCVLYRDTTWVNLPDDDPYAGIAPTWINGCCRDISKRTVQRVFANVFGYPLAVDPLTHEGVCVRKSNFNAVNIDDVKDMLVLVGPIPEDELADQHVYERLVDGLVPGLGHVELYAYVVGGAVVSIVRDIRLDGMHAGRLAKLLDRTVDAPRTVFSPEELEQIGEFCAAMGLDFGKLDIIRDRVDERIYILDANKTPQWDPRWSHASSGASGARWWTWFLQMVDQVPQAFTERFPTRSAIPTLAMPGATPRGVHDPQEGARDAAGSADGAQMAAQVRDGLTGC